MASTTFNPLSLSPDNEGDYIWYNPGGASFMSTTPAPAANISVNTSGLNLEWTQGQANPWTTISTAAEDASYYRAWRYGYFEVSMAWDPVVGPVGYWDAANPIHPESWYRSWKNWTYTKAKGPRQTFFTARFTTGRRRGWIATTETQIPTCFQVILIL